jgi:hypothetical protein
MPEKLSFDLSSKIYDVEEFESLPGRSISEKLKHAEHIPILSGDIASEYLKDLPSDLLESTRTMKQTPLQIMQKSIVNLRHDIEEIKQMLGTLVRKMGGTV